MIKRIWMKRIWFLWLGVAYVVTNGITAVALLFKQERFLAAILAAGSIGVGWEVWQRRRYLWDRREY